jgi:hypothetical protein
MLLQEPTKSTAFCTEWLQSNRSIQAQYRTVAASLLSSLHIHIFSPLNLICIGNPLALHDEAREISFAGRKEKYLKRKRHYVAYYKFVPVHAMKAYGGVEL